MNANTKEMYDTETENFYALKYNISNNNVNQVLIISIDLDKLYLIPGEFHRFCDNSLGQFAVLHLIIRSIKKRL